MSEENVEIVRVALAAEARHDASAIFGIYDDDIEWDIRQAGGPVAGITGLLRGHEGVRSWFRTWYEGFENVNYELEELVDAGDDVFVVVGQTGRGRGSGVEVFMRLYGVWTLRDEKVTRVAWFQERAAALEDLERTR
jgi:ketosteroid isomerase-like protein